MWERCGETVLADLATFITVSFGRCAYNGQAGSVDLIVVLEKTDYTVVI